MKNKLNKNLRGMLFLGPTLVMASSFTQKIYSLGVKEKTRESVAQALSIAGEKIGYRRINLDPRLVALTGEELKYVNLNIDIALKTIIKPEHTDREKLKVIYDYVVENLTYDYSTVNNSAYQALKQRRTMCAGYSQLFYLMSKKAGFDVSYVIGEAGNDLHIWNKIKLGEDNYYIDTTWASKDKAKRYEYFLIDANSLSKTHTWK